VKTHTVVSASFRVIDFIRERRGAKMNYFSSSVHRSLISRIGYWRQKTASSPYRTEPAPSRVWVSVLNRKPRMAPGLEFDDLTAAFGNVMDPRL
jgi:hypothetical protein